MRFTSVRFDGLASTSFKLIGASQTDPYVIKDIQGLGPTETDVSVSMTSDSVGYHDNSFANARELVFRIAINADYKNNKTVSDLREELYWMAESEARRGVVITFVNDEQDLCHVKGFVSRMEPSIFSQNTDLMVTFKCLDAKLTSPVAIKQESSNGISTIVPVGTARTMPKISIAVLKNTQSVSVARLTGNRTQVEEIFNLVGFQYLAGDFVVIGGSNGEKKVTMTRGVETFNHIRYMGVGSKWPQLDPGGPNVLSTWGSDYMQQDLRVVQVSYYPKFRGI